MALAMLGPPRLAWCCPVVRSSDVAEAKARDLFAHPEEMIREAIGFVAALDALHRAYRALRPGFRFA
jgi:hypothetical protein